MRKKIKDILNKEEGFTLVELLAVIVILGIIVVIAVPMIGNVVGRAQTGAKTAETELVVDAAQLYVLDNEVPTAGTITVDELVKAGYLEKTTSKNIKAADYVEITPVKGTNENINYTYEFKSAGDEG